LTQLGQIAMMTTDLALIGRLGDGAVAAARWRVGVLHRFTFGMGLVSAVARWRAGVWRRNPRMVRAPCGSGCGPRLISLPMIVPPLYGEQILLALGPGSGHRAPRATLSDGPGVGHHAGAVVSRDPRFMARSTGRSRDCGSPSAPSPPMRAGLSAESTARGDCRAWSCSAPGLAPRSSISGCFWRVLFAWRAGRSKNIMCWAASAIDWTLMRQLIVIGAPISMSFLMEYGLFAAAALLMGLISTTALAAHQIALQVTADPVHWCRSESEWRRRCGWARRRPQRPAAVKRAGLVATLLGIVCAPP